MSLRPWNRSRSSRIWWLDQGQTNSASTTMVISTGAAKRSTGRRKLIRLRPHENHTTISLLAYMRVSVAVIATNRLSVRIVDRWPSTVKPITSMTSDGLTRPTDACPSVRINMTVTTMVTSTTRVAPKLRPSSLRREESNNIGRKENADYAL